MSSFLEVPVPWWTACRGTLTDLPFGRPQNAGQVSKLAIWAHRLAGEPILKHGFDFFGPIRRKHHGRLVFMDVYSSSGEPPWPLSCIRLFYGRLTWKQSKLTMMWIPCLGPFLASGFGNTTARCRLSLWTSGMNPCFRVDCEVCQIFPTSKECPWGRAPGEARWVQGATVVSFCSSHTVAKWSWTK